MEENNKKQFVIIFIVVLLVVAGLIIFFFLRKKPELPSPSPVESTPKIEEPPPKEEELPEFIEKTEHYDTGELKAKYYVYRLKPNIKHKEYKEFYKSGKPKIECTYKDGKLDGDFKFFYENGQVAMQGNFRDGLKEGAWTEFFPNGRKKISCIYKNGKLDGLWQEFYDEENSPVHIEKVYINGELISELQKTKDGLIKYQKEHSSVPQK